MASVVIRLRRGRPYHLYRRQRIFGARDLGRKAVSVTGGALAFAVIKHDTVADEIDAASYSHTESACRRVSNALSRITKLVSPSGFEPETY